MQWIAINLFLLLLIGVGAGVFWLLGLGVQAVGLEEEIERWLLLVAGLIGIFASYYTGKFLHDLADGRYSRRRRRNQ